MRNLFAIIFVCGKDVCMFVGGFTFLCGFVFISSVKTTLSLVLSGQLRVYPQSNSSFIHGFLHTTFTQINTLFYWLYPQSTAPIITNTKGF